MRNWPNITLMATILIGAALLMGCAASTPTAATPQAAAETNWQYHDIVDAAFVAQHVTIPIKDQVMLIDSRPKRPKYDQGHIPMAVSIPASQFDKMTDLLPADKDTLLIFYCGGLKCRLSHDSARKAEALGYRNIKVFAKGFPGWMKVPGNYAAVSPEWLKSQLDNSSDLLLVDSRPKRAKYDKGHIPTAVSIPDMQFDELKGQLPGDKQKLVVFYCGGLKCKLSHDSARKAIALGYRNIKVMSAGYPGWKALGDTATMAKSAQSGLKAGKQEGSIDHELFRSIMAEHPESIYLIDVRDKEEYSSGTLKTAINIPVEQLEEKIKTLPTDKPIVFICGTGARSGESYYMVQDLRPALKNVYYLDGELTIHKDGTFSLKESV